MVKALRSGASVAAEDNNQQEKQHIDKNPEMSNSPILSPHIHGSIALAACGQATCSHRASKGLTDVTHALQSMLVALKSMYDGRLNSASPFSEFRVIFQAAERDQYT